MRYLLKSFNERDVEDITGVKGDYVSFFDYFRRDARDNFEHADALVFISGAPGNIIFDVPDAYAEDFDEFFTNLNPAVFERLEP